MKFQYKDEAIILLLLLIAVILVITILKVNYTQPNIEVPVYVDIVIEDNKDLKPIVTIEYDSNHNTDSGFNPPGHSKWKKKK